jgi:hypothetical protein
MSTGKLEEHIWGLGEKLRCGYKFRSHGQRMRLKPWRAKLTKKEMERTGRKGQWVKGM